MNAGNNINKQSSLIIATDESLNQLADNITNLVTDTRNQLAKTINSTLVVTYWNIGKYIVEFEQKGNTKAKYGTALLTSLANLLRVKLGKGYSRPNLNNMRKFYLLYPICQTVSDKLSWSHICELITIDDELERSFYEKECIAQNWNIRSLRRQMDSALYLRLAASKDKEEILQLAQKGIVIQQPEDIIKDTYTLEFLGLPDKKEYSELDLEQKLINNLQIFLLELGKGFAFIGRQYPLTISNRHYHIDLVFYHRILKCFVLIDLKKNAVKHKDIGQMNMYMGYFAKEENTIDDNPPIGIILSHNKDELLVEYATYGMDSKLFVSKYELYLPNKEELRRLVNNVIADNNNPKIKP
ncbi:PDDEXK nuclease domain-containing protein [Parabacteroides sp.]